MEIILGDIRDYDSVNKAMDGCDNVFHLAALIGIPYSYTSPLAYIRTNIMHIQAFVTHFILLTPFTSIYLNSYVKYWLFFSKSPPKDSKS